MQTSTTVPDSPTLSDSSKKKSNNKRAKASVACHECRKRKVKCEGVQPCGRCRKSNFRCIFPQQQSSKRGPPKQYIEILEARLQLMEKALRTIGGPASEILDDALSLDHHALQDKNGIHEDDTTIQQPNALHPTPNSTQQQLPDQYSMNELGQPYYTHDIYQHQIHSLHPPPPPQQQQRHMDLRRQPSDLSLSSNNNNNSIKSEPTTPVPTNHCLANIDSSLIDKYFEHVHPYTPMIDMPTFTQQLMNPNNPPPMLLLYAMCAVAARWSPSYATHSNEPAGFSYYQRAFVLIDEAGVTPHISTIQALVLLTKYQEHYKRAGYFYRPGYYLALAVDMCYSLKLPTLVSGGGNGDTLDYETKKRTFWMTFLYDLWTSIEEGRDTRFNNSQCSTDYPLSNGDSNGQGSEDLVARHNVVIRLGRILSDIYGFSRRLASRQQYQGSVRTTNQQIEEEGRLVVFQTTLETYLREISVIPRFDYAPSTTDNGKYPADTTTTATPEVFVGFLHMMYHYSIILLHRHHVLYPITKQNDINTHPYPHQQLCATSASIINSIANSLLESNNIDTFHYPTRGVQFTILCVTMAIAVHKFEMETAQDEQRKSTASTLYWQALSIVNRLSSETSAVELRYLARDAELAEMCGKLAVDNNNTYSMQQQQQQQPLSPDGSSSFTTTNNDGSSTSSSSPVLSSSVVSTSTGSVTDRMNRTTKMAKTPRRSTVSGSHLKRYPSQVFTSDSHYENNATVTSTMPAAASSPSAHSHLSSSGQQSPTSVSLCSQPQQHSPRGSTNSSSTVNQAALFNSSASITDPARLASMMQFGNIPLTPYNHHQQPIQLPMQTQQQPQRRMPRPLHHHYSHSQEDLRSLNHRHMNKTGYARAASPGMPSESRLKKHRSMKFLPMHSQQLQHTVQQYPPPSSLHTSTQQQQRIQNQHHQQQNQQYHRQQPHHQHHQMQPPSQPSSYDHIQNQQQVNYLPTPPPQQLNVQQQQQNESHYYSHNYPSQNMMTLQQHQMNFSGMAATTPLHRRHTISFTGMDTTGFTSLPMSMDYGVPTTSAPSSTSMMQIDAPNATTDQHNQMQHYPMHHHHQQEMAMASPSLSSNHSQTTPMSTSTFTPMMEDDPQMMMMAAAASMTTDGNNTMHHLLADSPMAAWGNGSSLDMDRKTEGHVLQ